MKDLTVLSLLDIYGDALTVKQREMLSDYYARDFSLSEIADNAGISRQAVHAAVKQAEESLFAFEKHFGVYAFVSKLNMHLRSIRQSLSPEDSAALQKLADVEEYVRSMYGAVR